MSANTKHMRAARARLRGAISMARQGVALMRLSIGLESMPERTREWLQLRASIVEMEVLVLDGTARGIDARVAEANEHLESMVLSRKKRG